MNWITIITEVLRFWTGGAGYRSKWFILQMLLFVQLGNSSLVINSRPHEEHVCPSIDIRNHVDKFKQLENCTVIEGYLRIVLIDHGVWSEYESLAFPKLVEITDYLLIFRAYGLRSLSKLFPNLAVIRGQKVFVNYALVVFEVKDIEELGLPSLMSISRGAVRLEKNSNLCYIDTINWDIITNVKKEDNFIVENRKINECVNTCPRHGCPYQERHENSQMQQTIHKQPLCWDFYNCQKVCKTCKGQSGCYTDKTPQGTSEKCCHPNCLGGCYGPDATDCIACRNVSYHGRCQTSCPPGTYKYHDRRCISPEDCKKNWHEVDRIKWKLFDDGKALKCQAECPNDYMESKEDPHTCIKCHGPCPKAHYQHKGHVGSELEESLGMIQEVSQYVKIVRSYALLSLRFLKSLRIIHGDRLHTSRYALFVLDNHNLVDIWDFKTHPKLNITKGKVFFHFNRKLCLNKIDDLVESVGLKDEIDTMDVSRQTNGDQVACNITELTLEIVTVKPTFAIIRWNNFHTGDIRELLSWVVNYREAPQKNITVFDARDACGTDTWRTDDVRPDVDNSAAHVATIIHELKPYTQYAVYVNAYTISSATRGAMSAIKYFRTEPGQPSPARDIRVKESKSKELHITWKPPSEPNGNVTHYFVTWQPMKLAIDKFERRNYCEDRLTNYHKLNTTNKSTKTDEAKKKNETDESGCKCPKKEVVKPVDEAQRHFQIEFENALQNAIYRTNHQNDTPEDHLLAITSNSVTKGEDSTGSSMNDHMGGSSLYRKKRDSPPSDNYLPSTKSPQPHLNVPPALTTSDLSNYIGNSSSSLLNSSFGNGSGYGFEEEQEEDNLQYAAVYGKTELILPALHHFQEYSIEVIACHEYKDLLNEKYCSNRAIDSARTQPNPKADTIQHENITETYVAHSNGTLVRIRWPEPPDPNGLIVTYHLEMKRIGVDNLKPDEYCITHKQYKKDGGFTAQGLAPGNWTYRIRASSLAGFGPWTPYLFVFVEGNGANDNLPLGLIMGFISTAFILLIVMLFGLVCYIKKKRGLPDQSALYASVNPDYWGTSDVYLPDEWEVDRDKVELIKELGNGSFGMVYEGIAKSLNGIPKQNVAIKTVTENASIKDRIEFLNEASVMKAFLCHHVVQLIGVVSKGQPTLVIMELMSNGDLKTFLRMHRPDYEGSEKRKPPTLNRILQMAGEIADGMAYLSVKKFVHRDLAARNCMVADTLTVKIGDFGMTRDIYETDYYRKGGKGLLPVRWMAPESLRDGVFSSQSDVWSYGVVLWEMATLAAQPYQGLANEQVLKFVVDGKKMEMPENCPDKLYNLMMGCWKYQPSKRPTFNEIIAQLVPDLNENFRHVSFFFSDLNTQKDLEGIEATDDDDEEEEEDGGLEGVNTPLTGSPKHRVDLHHQEECISDYEHVNNDSNTSAILSGSLQNSGELDSSHSTLSYDSHLKHSPSSSPHNQNIYLANNIEKGDVQHFSPPLSKGDCVGEPCDPASNVLKNTPQYQPPPYMLRHQNELPSQQKWSPDTNSNPPSLPHSNEGSKGSSKSSRSSNGMNGISNGHIPRIIVPNPQC